VADQHDRTGQGPQELGEIGRIASEITKRIAEPDRAETSALPGADLSVEAPVIAGARSVAFVSVPSRGGATIGPSRRAKLG
jgi:hypothetical protein